MLNYQGNMDLIFSYGIILYLGESLNIYEKEEKSTEIQGYPCISVLFITIEL